MSNEQAIGRAALGAQPPRPRGRYVPAVLSGSTVHTAGMTPRRDGRLTVTGRVGGEVDPAVAREAAGLAAGNALAAVRSVLPPGAMFRCVEMVVYIACADGFTELSAVADGASEVVERALGPASLPARSAIGVYLLPGNAPVEVAVTAHVGDGPGAH
ncbi:MULTISPECIES: RidA family protein [Rhodococcus]|uniref:RidA family protein n=1 Tax=Rhodococcus TaxID=1827 RepID=UPI00193C2071|nr:MULTISPECIES: RidA family protein [Rhodococcus]QRI76430.1 RidA family protein [Rhodococcus aetherivorans]QSE59841.1 RidA family protein [Rhodococcus sp. PSBB066]QSE68852.1 RidA family protein [Rhodococcus sp. PSBB049]